MSPFKKNLHKPGDPFVWQTGRIHQGRVKANGRFIGEEVFNTGVESRDTVGSNFNRAKIKLIIYFFLLGLLILGARIYWLQVANGAYYHGLAEGNRLRLDRVEAQRGIIYDVNKKTLVRNVANFVLYLLPADLPKNTTTAKTVLDRVYKILPNADWGAIMTGLTKIIAQSPVAYQPYFLADNLTYEQAIRLTLAKPELPGVILTNKNRRQYDFPDLSFSQVIGYTGKISAKQLVGLGDEYQSIDYYGQTGIEHQWESDLRGQFGVKQTEVDAFGRIKKVISQTAPLDGHNLLLSIDVDAQAKLTQLVQAQLDKLHLRRAAAIALNPNNGEIIAFVSLPSFDNNLFARGISQTDYNKLLNDPGKPLLQIASNGNFPSGSVIKPVIATAALQEGVINENTTVLSNGGLRINQWFFPDWKAGGHGITNVRKALAESVNTFFYYIGGGYQDFQGLGIDRIIKYLDWFNLGQPTNIDLPGEADGFLPTRVWKETTKKESWYIGDTYHVAIGQGDLLVTPLQVADYTMYFANGGTFYQPHLVKQILDSHDNLIKNITVKSQTLPQISSANIQIVREGMRQTITAGSARSLGACVVPVAGKTGTAQWSTKAANHAWFTGFAPYDNPQLVITILIPEGGEGSSTAVPIAKDFINWYFKDRATTTPPTQ